MDPLTIAGIGSLASGLFQAYNSAKARKANQQELDRIEEKFNQLIPPQYDMSITDPPALITKTLQSPEFSKALEGAKFDLSSFTPEDYKVIGKYAPEIAPMVKEVAPTLIKESQDMKTGRDAQLAALKKFTQVGRGEFDPEYQEAVTKSRLSSQAEAQSRQNSLLQDFARRGQANSGLSLAAQIGATSNSMNNNAMQGLSAATESYKNRLNALAQGAQLGSQISNQDQAFQGQNAGIINAFNQRMAANQNQYEQNRAGTLNQAQLQNLQTAQGLANQNVAARNSAALNDRNRLDDITKYNYAGAQANQARDDSLAKYNYGNSAAERDYQNQLATQKAAWVQQQKQYGNQMLGQQYDDQYRKTAGSAGIMQQQGQNAMQGAADMNSAVQGLANAGLTYAMYKDKYGKKEEGL